MKKLTSITLGFVFLFATLFQTGCIGSFKLTNNVYSWNTSLDGKAVQEIVFLAFLIIPVYSATLIIDAVILNTIEFWTGSNPMAMNDGEREVQIVVNEGVTYEITASKNMFHVLQLDGEKAGQSYDLVFNTGENAWFIEANGISVKFAEFDPDLTSVNVIKPNGDVIELENVSRNAAKAALSLDYATVK
ncbi:MAG: DUF3332 domain-containing protein [Bacteroidales bacterium]